MLKPLDFDFPVMSELSVRPPHAVSVEEMIAEVGQERADRESFYRRLVAKGTMSQADCDRHIALVGAILSDLKAGFGSAESFGWDVKVRELRRELQLRRNRWPKRIGSPSDPLDKATATRRMERLEAVHFHYWVELFGADDEFGGGRGGFDPPHFLPSDARYGRLRAHYGRIWTWEREALRLGAPAARPGMAVFYAKVDAGEPDAVGIWNHYLFCAERCGFIQPEEPRAALCPDPRLEPV